MQAPRKKNSVHRTKHPDLNRLSDIADLNRIAANAELDPKNKSALGQFMTSKGISSFMASLFDSVEGDVRLLDPGCGVGSLTAAFIDRALNSNKVRSVSAELFEIEKTMLPYLDDLLKACRRQALIKKLPLDAVIHNTDFILSTASSAQASLLDEHLPQFTHAIINPPYKKISTASEHRRVLSLAKIEVVNLYAGFVALAAKLLKPGGELVAIIPRSFCNGPYYESFRKSLLIETAIKHIHIFESRTHAFQDDDVLQENVIVHCVKGAEQGAVVLTASPGADFHYDEPSKTITATDLTTRTVGIEKIVNRMDPHSLIHIATTESDQQIIDSLSGFVCSLEDLGIEVSTGPVVDFRLDDDLRESIEPGAVPLIYPIHLEARLVWPKKSKKPNAIKVSSKSAPWLWENRGAFVLTRRFSSKEERRRILASFYDGSLPFTQLGFENKLNVFHKNKLGFEPDLAKGLCVYLNSTVLDRYYRQFGGHTQVNSSDLRAIPYPAADVLRRLGKKFSEKFTQANIDELIFQEIKQSKGGIVTDPLLSHQKITDAMKILGALGMPRAQINERSALTLLALSNLEPEDYWAECERPLRGVTPIMDWCRDVYGKQYAPNTRETFRRQTLHQFVEAGIALYNPDKPDRPVNSPKACYQLAAELCEVLSSYGTQEWNRMLPIYLKKRPALADQYARARTMNMIPLLLDKKTEITLTPGEHSQLIHDIVMEFGPRFAPGAEVIYVGDTGDKTGYFMKERLNSFGVQVDKHGKMPDVVLYDTSRKWLLLIEAVTSHGPVDAKRHRELASLFRDAKPGLVYVTAFPSRHTMVKYLPDISWETEVWLADAPTHLIHFNGDRFLGPHG